MSGINQEVAFSVCRIKVKFVDSIGNEKNTLGTGFQVDSNGVKNIITNRHNIDPTLKLGSETDFKLFEMEIELRRLSAPGVYHCETSFFPVDLMETKLVLHSTADVAAIVNPRYKNHIESYRLAYFQYDDIADSEYLKNDVAMMDGASFIGYPGNSKSQWWDTRWNLGIARTVNIASHPSIPFTHRDIITTDTTLVSGLSFSGSSGSVVMLHSKGIKTGEGLGGGYYVRPKVIGIMSGHWQERGCKNKCVSGIVGQTGTRSP